MNTAATAPRKTPYLEQKPSSLRYYQDGPPQHVDLDRWQLLIGGLIARELKLTYSDLLAMPQVEESRRMVCVCNWSIRRTWKGVLLASVLQEAGLSCFAGLYLKQTSIGTREKGAYQATIPLADAIRRRSLLIHSVDGERLPIEQGFPLRLLDFGLYGYKSVKGLSRLEITREFQLGEWESRAGYDIDGTIRPKKYWGVDVRKWIFVQEPGEEISI